MKFKRRLKFDDRVRFSKRMGMIYLFLLVVIGSLGVGYAVIRSNLQITGSAHVQNANWDIHFYNLQVTQGSATASTPASITATDTVTFGVTLANPGEFYEFTVDAVNGGTMNAELNSVSITPQLTPAQQEFLDLSVTYVSSGKEVKAGDILYKNYTKRMKVRAVYKDGIDTSLYPETDQNYNVSITQNYVQTDNSLNPPAAPSSFSTDSWETIVTAVQEGDTSLYNVGDTKTVDMGSLGTYTLRIANKSTPSECSTSGFSQTACGLVLEFSDVITTHKMNSTATNVGGWPASEMRTYLNDETEGVASIYNALPAELRSIIIPTYVVSGHGSQSGATNYTSTDKLYLLSTKEVGFDVDYDSAKAETRILDFYNLYNNNQTRVKKNLSNSATNWWLRAAHSLNPYDFSDVTSSGSYGTNNANSTYGVSPAFRIG